MGDLDSERVGDFVCCERASEAVDERVGVAIEEEIFAGTDVPLLTKLTGMDRAEDIAGLNKCVVRPVGGVALGFEAAVDFGPWLGKVGDVGTGSLVLY
jgi:hypothetical protein